MPNGVGRGRGGGPGIHALLQLGELLADNLRRQRNVDAFLGDDVLSIPAENGLEEFLNLRLERLAGWPVDEDVDITTQRIAVGIDVLDCEIDERFSRILGEGQNLDVRSDVRE